MADEKQQTITIDGTEYNVAGLSDNAKAQVTNLRVTDAEIEKLKQKQKLAIYQAARTAYAKALQEELPKHAESTQEATH